MLSSYYLFIHFFISFINSANSFCTSTMYLRTVLISGIPIGHEPRPNMVPDFIQFIESPLKPQERKSHIWSSLCSRGSKYNNDHVMQCKRDLRDHVRVIIGHLLSLDFQRISGRGGLYL